MGFIQHIPGIRRDGPPPPAPFQKGIGVLGLHEGRTLLLGLERTAKARAVAACDIAGEKIEACRRERPDLFYTMDYGELLERSDVDIVAIYTPDPLHGAQIERAFEAGQVGALELADAHYIHRMDWFYEKSPWAATETDWIFLGMSHPIDLLRWYLGPIREVQAYGTRSDLGSRHGLKGFDVYTANVAAASGRIGRAMGNYGVHELPTARNCIELVLYGSGGTSLAQYHDMRYVHTVPDGPR